MRLRAGSLVLVVALVAAQLAAHAQQAGKVYRVGYLQTPVNFHQAFERMLSGLGYEYDGAVEDPASLDGGLVAGYHPIGVVLPLPWRAQYVS